MTVHGGIVYNDFTLSIKTHLIGWTTKQSQN